MQLLRKKMPQSVSNSPPNPSHNDAAEAPSLFASKELSEEKDAITYIDNSLDAAECPSLLIPKCQPPTEIIECEKTLEVQNGDDLSDLGSMFEGLMGDGGKSATDVIHSLSSQGDPDSDLAMKGIIEDPRSCASAQVLADYNDSLGLDEVAVMLRSVVKQQTLYNCGKKGKRAEQAFAALSGEKEKEFQLEKELKGAVK